MILLDTHVFIWFVNGDDKLSEKHLKILTEEESKHISVISCWEISLLLEKERIKLKYPFDDWIQKALTASNVKLINLDLDIILTYHKLIKFHSDPADKLISATSICKNIPLLTFDRKLIEYTAIKIVKI